MVIKFFETDLNKEASQIQIKGLFWSKVFVAINFVLLIMVGIAPIFSLISSIFGFKYLLILEIIVIGACYYLMSSYPNSGEEPITKSTKN